MSNETPRADASDVPGGNHPDDQRGDASEATPDYCQEPSACAYTQYRSGEEPSDLPATGEDAAGVEASVWDALYGIEDPEMPISIVNLGLVYGVEVADGHAAVAMTLTYTGCPARNLLLDEVESTVANVAGVESVDLELVWSPPWSVEMVTEAGREDLREFGVSI